MDKVFFKIIIPNYNNFKYIKKCIDSIVNQTFQDFFVIIVDDMSTDGSDRIAQIYEKRYPEKIHLIRQTKKNYSGGCRNIGIDYSVECAYYMFIDGDDYLYDNNVLYKLHTRLSEKNPPMIVFNYYRILNSKCDKFITKKFYDYKYELANCPFGAAWTRAIRSDHIKPFLTECCHGEDTFQLLNVVDSIDNFDDIDYYREYLYVYNRSNPQGTINQHGLYEKTKHIFYESLTKMKPNVKHDYILKSIQYRETHII